VNNVIIVIATSDQSQFSRYHTNRRSKLPATNPESDIGLWNLLRKNIGKDLSKISMPVSLNEPLNALQVSILFLYNLMSHSLPLTQVSHNEPLNALQVSIF